MGGYTLLRMTPREMTPEEKHEHAMAEVNLCREIANMRFRIIVATWGACRVEHGPADCTVRESDPMEIAG